MLNIEFKADLTDLKDLARNYPGTARKMTNNRLDESSLLLARAIREETPEGAGVPQHIKGTIMSHSVKYGNHVKVSTPVLYALPLEKGAQQGHAVSKVGMESLQIWVEKKLGFSGEEAKQVTFLIARAFRRGKSKGIHFKGAHMFKKGYKKSEQKIKDILAKIPDDIVRNLEG